MGHRIQGSIHARLHSFLTGMRSQTGQGTVEYVALLFLLGAIFAAVVTAGNGKDFGVTEKIGTTLKNTLDAVGGGKKG
jgi:hypothetical protein